MMSVGRGKIGRVAKRGTDGPNETENGNDDLNWKVGWMERTRVYLYSGIVDCRCSDFVLVNGMNRLIQFLYIGTYLLGSIHICRR